MNWEAIGTIGELLGSAAVLITGEPMTKQYD
jgi:hypothetical protein